MTGPSAMEYHHACQRKWPLVSIVALTQKYSPSKKCMFCSCKTEPNTLKTSTHVDAVEREYFVTHRVQFICIQEEQAKDGAGRENGYGT